MDPKKFYVQKIFIMKNILFEKNFESPKKQNNLDPKKFYVQKKIFLMKNFESKKSHKLPQNIFIMDTSTKTYIFHFICLFQNFVLQHYSLQYLQH